MMAYPGKTSSQAIRSAAIVLLEREGGAGLTIRGVASALGLAPNALYRHFASREALVAAIADEVARRLLAAVNARLDEPQNDQGLKRPGSKPPGPKRRLRVFAEVYAEFARANPDLYQTLMTDTSASEAGLPRPLGHDELWAKVIELLVPLTGAENAPAAAVTLWGLLHGIWGLERANLLGGKKPGDVSRFAVDALIKGLRA